MHSGDAERRVRHDLARLGADAGSAPPVPDAVTARIVAALRAAPPPPAHAARPPVRLRVVAAIVGLGAAAVGVVLGTATVRTGSAPAPPAGPTAELITVSARDKVPLSDRQIAGLLTRPPDYGPLDDPRRRAACLGGLGYPGATPILGARPVDVHGRPGVLLVLAGETPDALVAVVVRPNCDSAESGLLAETVVSRP
jgi:hypothetical protein